MSAPRSESEAGKVYLVGAGPGDPGLITARGLDVLRRADLVAYDRLIPQELLDEAPAAARKVFVGRSPGEPPRDQSTVEKLMIDEARAGSLVVRLKGGDPFVFGRGAEEASALREAGVDFDVVPGVSSALAAPAYAGIPMTQRGLARSFLVLTAHEIGTGVGYRAGDLSSPDTIVLLMGVASLRAAARTLIEDGRDPAEPAAVIEWGTTARQRTVVGTLQTIAALAEGAGIQAPATAVVGKVVETRSAIRWFETRPLFGVRVVVTRSRSQAQRLSSKLSDAGADVIHVPTIEILDPASWAELDQAVRLLTEGYYKWVIFTSVNTVEKFFGRLAATRHDARAFGRTKVAAVGRATAEAVEVRGIRPDLVPTKFTGEALVAEIGHGTGGVLIPRAPNAPNALVRQLRGVGWTPEEVVAYRNVAPRRPPDSAGRLSAGDFDVVTFTSASTARNFVKLIGPPDSIGLGPEDPPARLVACIGPVTAAEAERRGLRVDVVAEEHTTDGLVAALIARRSQIRGRARDGNIER